MYNEVTMLGRVATVPQFSNLTKDNKTYSVLKFSIAVNYGKKVQYFFVVAWNKVAMNVAMKLQKGMTVFVNGFLISKKRDDFYETEISARQIKCFASPKTEQTTNQETLDTDINTNPADVDPEEQESIDLYTTNESNF
ncbi:single-stranded DNA-binding protein [Mycoplasma sp. NEAQ87857]|uniref:single-stranded DNA-binding protein n=1 Tax=Mycoplasma sp. NEAQ87857 TaxID=2683967 RepID=UPI00131762F8|nr:single-stranded DNA-binding protein [Mycoplasma sp. NEAQ87857]QGZ97977.1 single-stranded DNA-binding protein [Mycoplasma sp. NEAQ87857]